MIGGECCEWFGGGDVVAVVTECWFCVVNPTRWVGCVGGFGVVFPLAPGFPLIGGLLVVVVVG